MNIYPSYTYYLEWSYLNLKYYGYRSNHRNKWPPENDFWIYYKSSSVAVKNLLALNVNPDIRFIDKIFKTPQEARCYEIKILTENDAKNSVDWLNQNNGTGGSMVVTKETRQKMSLAKKDVYCGENNPMFGRKHTNETKQIISESRKGQFSGEKNPFFNKKHTKESLKIMSDAHKGQQTGENHSGFKGHFITPWGKFPSAIEAAEACPVIFSGPTVKKYCLNNQKTVMKNQITPSVYLTNDMLGKTFEEIGFSFESRDL